MIFETAQNIRIRKGLNIENLPAIMVAAIRRNLLTAAASRGAAKQERSQARTAYCWRRFTTRGKPSQ